MKKPAKPSKYHISPPSRIKVQYREIAISNSGDIVLIDQEDIPDDFWESYEYIDRLDFATLNKVHKLLPNGVDNFNIESDNEYGYWTISYQVAKDDITYQIELSRYNDLLKKYEQDMKEWEESMKKHELFTRQQKIAELQRQVKKLQNE